MQTKFMTLPIAGSIRHGEKQEKNGKSKPVELGHFVAKIQDDAMSHLLDKFKTKYSQSRILNIYFFDEYPLSIRRVRYNTGGTTCYCKLDDTKAMEKVNNKWTQKECLESCEHRVSKGNTKPQCTVEATLKFMIPDISTDRIWFLKTKIYYSILNISSYITLQKKLGHSLKGNYNLFLKTKEDIIDGKKFNNYVLDLISNENFNSTINSNLETQKTTNNTTRKYN